MVKDIITGCYQDFLSFLFPFRPAVGPGRAPEREKEERKENKVLEKTPHLWPSAGHTASAWMPQAVGLSHNLVILSHDSQIGSLAVR
jgi:hypothetical protein